MNCFKYKEMLENKEMLKKKGGLGDDGASTSEKQLTQAGIVEEAVEEPCDVLSVNSGRGKGRLSDVSLLDSGCTYHMCPME